MGLSAGIIPLAVLCAGLVVGGIAAIYITRKVAQIRLMRQIMLAQQEALAEEEFLKQKPTLTDIYIGPPPAAGAAYRVASASSHTGHARRIPWADLQPITTDLSSTHSCPHPHRTLEPKPSYAHAPLIDGNVLKITVGIAMPSSSLNPGAPTYSEGGPSMDTLDYSIGTAEAVVCTLLASRQRLVGFN